MLYSVKAGKGVLSSISSDVATVLHLRTYLTIIHVEGCVRHYLFSGAIEWSDHFSSDITNRFNVSIPYQIWNKGQSHKLMKAADFLKERTKNLGRVKIRAFVMKEENHALDIL